MKIVKKLLSVVLAISMIFGAVSVMASALAPDTAIDMYLSSDKETYTQGENIIITISQQTIPEVGATYNGGVFVFFYDSAYFEPTTTSTEAADHNVVGIAPGLALNDSTVVTSGYTGTIPGKNNWNAAVKINAIDESVELDCTTKTALLSIPLKVKDNAPNGTTIIGFSEEPYQEYDAYSNDAINGGIAGYDDDYGFGTTVNYGFNNLTVTVGAATAESIIKNGGNQIRFRGVGIDGNFSAYQNKFDVRTVAKISAADFKAKFGATDAEALEKIKDIGFVFAPMSETFEMDAAIALAKKDTTGQVSEGIYTKKPCKYIGHESDNADYIFTCIVENIEDTTANRANGFTCLAYACDVDGNYYFFDAAATADYQALFTAHFKG